MTTVAVDAHDAAVVAAIAGSGLPTGLAAAPDAGGWQGAVGESDFAVYAIVYPIAGGDRDGSLDDPTRDATIPYQVTVVADTPAAARAVTVIVEAALVAVAVPGRTVLRVIPEGAGGGVTRDDDTAGPPLFYATPRFTLWTVPNL